MSKGLGVMGSANGTEREAWGRVKARLKTELGEEVFLSWFGRAELEAISGGVVRLSVPTRFLKSWILSHYQDRLIELWRTEVGEVYRLEIGVRNAAFTAPPQQPAAAHAPPAQPAVEAVEEGLTGSPLDPRLTFETYRVGRSNALAAAAARKALEPGLHFNPLYIHSGVGLGKTHLLQAMAHAAEKGKPPRRVLYLTAERFMYRFVTALKANTALAFKDQLRGIELLLIDDIQFLQGRATQNEFCHILNALIDAGRQVAVAADRPPAELDSLDERVRSRLAGGLVVEIQPLDEELRYG
ncbi:MAG: DnaA/Hda family protein, partial [Pseudomonadota bacterium]|nr:DnaA/Hda family protein [Pseudomonadota bacterium]